MHRLFLSVAATAAAVLGLAGPASAGVWSAPERLTATGFSPQSSIGPDGTAGVLWVPQQPGEFGGRGLRFAVRAPDGSLGPAQELFTDDAYDEARMWFPFGRVAVAADGTVSVAWYTGGTIRVATTGPGGLLGPVQVLATDIRVPSLDLEAGPQETIVTWAEPDAVRMAVRRGASFGPAEPGFGVAVAVDARGVATSARGVSGSPALEVARRPPGGKFGAAQVVGSDLPGYYTQLTDLVGHRDGSAALLIRTWEEPERGQIAERRWAATASPGGPVRPPTELDRGVEGPPRPYQYSAGLAQIGAGRDGAALVATEAMRVDEDGSTSRSRGLQLQAVGTDGRGRAPALVRGLESSHVPRVGFDTGGAGVVVTSSLQGTYSVTVPRGATGPCPVVRIASHQSIPVAPTLDAGPVGMISWQEVPSSNVHVVLHRAIAGCPEVPAAAPPPEQPSTPPEQPSTAPEQPSTAPERGEPTTGAQEGGELSASPQPASSPAPAAAPQGAELLPYAPLPGPAARLARVAPAVTVDARGRTVSMRLTCPGTTPCRGRLELLRRVARPGTGRALGSAAFNVPAGASRTIRFTLRMSARSGLRRAMTLKAIARVTPPAGAPRTVPVTLRRAAR